MQAQFAPSPEQFARLVAETLVRRYQINGQLAFDHQEFNLVIKDQLGRPLHMLNLHNSFKEYCAAEQSTRQSIVERTCSLYRLPPVEEIDYSSRLLPQIKDRWSVEHTSLAMKLGRLGNPERTSQVSFPHGVLASHFALTVAYDMPEQMAYVNSTQLNSWGISFMEALDQATSNLSNRSEFVFSKVANKSTGKIMIAECTAHDDYDAARIVFSDAIRSLAVEGDQVIFLLNQNSMMIAGTQSDEGITLGISELLAAQKRPRALPPFPILLTGNGFSAFQLPPSDPLIYLLRPLQLEYLYNIYLQQRNLLLGEFNQLVGEWDIANYDLVIDQQSQVMMSSMCVLHEGMIPVLMPGADSICLQQGSQIIAVADWETFALVMADHLQETNYYPQLYALDQFPSPEQIALLQQRQI